MTVMRRCSPFIYTAIVPSQAPNLSSHMIPPSLIMSSSSFESFEPSSQVPSLIMPSSSSEPSEPSSEPFKPNLEPFEPSSELSSHMMPSSEPFESRSEPYGVNLRAFRAHAIPSCGFLIQILEVRLVTLQKI